MHILTQMSKCHVRHQPHELIIIETQQFFFSTVATNGKLYV